MTAVTVTRDSWDEAVLAIPGAVIVGICAPRSGPCRGFRGVVDALADELADAATVVSVDLNDDPHLAQRYDVSSLPTLLVFRSGRLVGRLIGTRSRAGFLRELSPYLV